MNMDILMTLENLMNVDISGLKKISVSKKRLKSHDFRTIGRNWLVLSLFKQYLIIIHKFNIFINVFKEKINYEQ